MPQIVKLIPRRSGEWVEVVPDAGPGLKLPYAYLPSWVSNGERASEAQWLQLGALARFYGLYDRALKILGRREHFTAELSRKLAQREPDRALVRDVITRCQEQDYLDDARAAASTVQGLLAGGGCGKARLKHELFKRGCPKALVEAALEEHAGDLDEQAEIDELLEKWRKSLAAKAQSLRAKLTAKGLREAQLRRELEGRLGETVIRLLRSRGFSGEAMYASARKLVREIAGEW